MAVHNLSKCTVILNAFPVSGLADVQDAVVLSPQGRKWGNLTIRLMPASTTNLAISIVRESQEAFDTIFQLPFAIQRHGTSDLIMAQSAAIGGHVVEGCDGTITLVKGTSPDWPEYSIGRETGIITYNFVCIGIGGMITGSL